MGSLTIQQKQVFSSSDNLCCFELPTPSSNFVLFFNPTNIHSSNSNITVYNHFNDLAAPAAAPTEAIPDASRGKNKFFLAKWFGFGK